MKTGIDYYPEQRSKSAIQRDAELMSKTGIKLVRMGEKSWCKFEPHNNNFCFEWFDEIISVFSRYGIGIVLRIPAGKPPARQAPVFSCSHAVSRRSRCRDGNSSDKRRRQLRSVLRPG